MAKLLFEEYNFRNRWMRILTHPILLFVVLNELTDAKLSIFEKKFETVFGNDDVMTFRVF